MVIYNLADDRLIDAIEAEEAVNVQIERVLNRKM
jgi:hypothetical protein